MNRRRNEEKTPFLVFFALILAAAIAAGGGILHACYKNRQVQISREIDATERNIVQCRLDIRTSEMRMDLLLNRFVIRKQIEQNGSLLRPIVMSVIEEIDDAATSRRSVASATP
jgi:hypothetical protein